MPTKKFSLSIEIPETKSLATKVYEKLLQAIVEGQIRGGDRIVETDLVKSLGISRTPIREALHMLEADGLVELMPYRGVVVKQITPQEVRENLEMKAMTEGFATWSLAMRFKEEDIEYLESVLVDVKECIANNDLKGVIDANSRFHKGIIQSVRNEKLLKLYEGLDQSIKRFHTIGFMTTSGLQTSFDEHSRILDRIRNHDPAGAETAAREHAFNTLNRVLTQLKKSTGE